MLSFVSLLGLMFAIPGPLPEGVYEALRHQVATSWGLDSERMVIESGSARVPVGFVCCGPIRLGAEREGRISAVIASAGGGRPMSVRFRAGTDAEVWTARRDLRGGSPVLREDFEVSESFHWGRPDALDTRDSLLRRRVRSGERLTPASLTPPRMITMGEPVRLEVHRGEVFASRDARARGHATYGEWVEVLLPDGRTIRAQVIGPDRVRAGH